jgi:hexosaminidase
LLTAILFAAATQAAGARPETIPALQRWTASPGVFRLPSPVRVVVPRRYWRQLISTGRVLASDLSAETNRRVSILRGRPARPGEIVLLLSRRDRALGAEGYRLRVDNSVTITAPTVLGVFNGTRTLLQLLALRRPIPRGLALDWPRYPDRGLMIDLGRRVYPARWIETEVRALAYLKMNVLHLHLTDDQRWGIDSATHPEVVSANALTKPELREILAVADRYHVTVVPEIDMPAHMGAFLAKHPDLELKLGTLVNPPASPDSRKLDITSPAALRAVRDLLDEYLPLFPGPYWDVGADEYLSPADEAAYPQLLAFARAHYGPGASIKDAILGFVNWVDAIVRQHGKRLWAWHDELGGGTALTARPDIVVNWWVNFSPLSEPRPPTPAQLLQGGHEILNAGWFPTYYTEDLGPIQGKPNIALAYETWEVNRFCGPTFQDHFFEACYVVPPSERRNLGSTINAWDDHELTLSQLASGLAPRLAVLAQKTWSSPPLTPSYSAFQAIMRKVGVWPPA